MLELNAHSTLTQEDIEKNFEEVKLFDGIMAGLEDALAHEKSKSNETVSSKENTLKKQTPQTA